MEVQVDFLGIDVALKLVPIWNLFSHDGFCTMSKLFILKVRPHLYTHFLDSIHFLQKKKKKKNIACIPLIVFSIAKGLTTCQLGGVISTKKVLF